MAKPSTGGDRFKLSCEVEAGNLGTVLAALTKMGLKNVGFELVSVVPFNKNHRPGGVSGPEFLAAWVKDHPTFTSADVAAAFEAEGRTKSSAYPVLYKLVSEGIVRKLGNGSYARADVKNPVAPKKPGRAPGTDLVLQDARRNHGTTNTERLRKVFADVGLSPASAHPAVAKLLKAKLIRRVGENGEGRYALTARATEVKTKAALNGTPVEVIANG